MITVTLNEKPIQIGELTSLATLFEQQGITPSGKACALNDLAIPPVLWGETMLHDGDRILIFRAFYGG